MDNTEVDVILLDLDMPVMDGREALHIIRKRFKKEIKIIILSLHYSEEHVRKYMGAGADCYLSKESDHKTLVDAIKGVHEKGYFFYDKVSPKLVSELMNNVAHSGAVDGDPLSKREIEVIKMICHGLTSQEIAKRLRLSIRTVENHRHRISKKIKARNTADIIVHAIKNGYFDVRY